MSQCMYALVLNVDIVAVCDNLVLRIGWFGHELAPSKPQYSAGGHAERLKKLMTRPSGMRWLVDDGSNIHPDLKIIIKICGKEWLVGGAINRNPGGGGGAKPLSNAPSHDILSTNAIQ